ncbi:MAG: DUF309 domain-containing protein [Phycisphaeraceae bacterium]|nr:DUF309 domain-containing protein [Phycisphaeraceae bacterium]
MTDDEEDRLFFEGVELFNAGQYFEAHEVWEDVWVMASGSLKLFYQGLIQCAVTLEHVRRGNPRGVRSVWETCQTKFIGQPSVVRGIDIAAMLTDMRQAIAPILALPESAYDPALPHGRDLPFDWEHPPRIQCALRRA